MMRFAKRALVFSFAFLPLFAFAEQSVAGALSGNLLRNPEFVSQDGLAPDGWAAGRSENLKGAFTCTGGVLRISACSPAYCHGVSQTVPIDGTKSHWVEADLKCDALEYYGNVRYTLLDAKGKELVSDRPLLHPHFKGPQRKWFRIGLPIPAQEIERTRKLKLTFSVYNKSRKPAQDLALYIRNPSLSVYSGQAYRPLPPSGSRAEGKLPPQPFPNLLPGRNVYCLEKGGVGYLNLNSAVIPRGKASELKVEAPDGVTYELHLRTVKVPFKLFRREETEKGLFKLPGTINWAVGGNTLLFAADDTVPSKFALKLTFKAGGETRVVDVPVAIIQGPPPGKLPKTARYRSWNCKPLVEIDQATSPLGKALAAYWQATGFEMKPFVNITSVFPYRDDLKNPLARKAVGPHGTPTGIPCDSDLQAKGPEYYRDRLKSAGFEKALAETEMAIWDYEPYVVGPVTVGCFCEDCRRAFAKEMGISETPSPETILKSHVKDWVPFRCRQRAASVKVAVEGLKMLAPHVKFGLCTMPMAPDYGDKNPEKDFSYWRQHGIDSPLYEDFTDAFCSMNYSSYQTYFRSLEREVNELKKPKFTLLENGWGEPRRGALVGLQLFGAFFAGLERPFLAQGLDISDGDQLSEIRRALQLVAETEQLWEGARLCKDKCKTEVSGGLEARFWSLEREAKDGTRYVLAANSSAFGPVTVKITAPWGTSRTLDLPSCSYQFLTFRP